MKIILVFTLFMLSGCAPTVLWKSEPPGAIISGPAHGGGTFSYYTPMKMSYPDLAKDFKQGNCSDIFTPTVRWTDGTTLGPEKICLIYRESEHTLIKPISSPKVPAYQAPKSSGVGIDDAKKKCADLGFKSGTETFGNCVLQLSK